MLTDCKQKKYYEKHRVERLAARGRVAPDERQ